MRMTRDFSVPGQRLVRVETQAGVQTLVSRSDANGQVTVMFDAPVELSWFTCAHDTECRLWADRCNCDALETVNVAFLAKLRGLRHAQCAASGGARPCPCAIEPKRQSVPVCRASLCTCTARPR